MDETKRRSKIFWRALGVLTVLFAVVAAAAYAADEPVLDPDGAIPFTEDSSAPSFNLGDVCQDTDASHDVLVKAKNGSGSTWNNGALLTLSANGGATGVNGSDVTVGVGSPSSFTLDGNWNSLAADTLSTAFAVGHYTVNSAALGAHEANADWTLTGASGSGSLARNTPNVHISWNVIDCSPPANVPPNVEAGGTYSGGEGSNIALNGASADDNGDGGGIASVLWTIDSQSVGTGSCSLTNATSLTLATINCTDNGTAIVKLTATDDDGGATAFDTANVTISNVAPTGTFNTPASSVNEGSGFNLSLTGVTDPSSVDTAAGFTYAFDCGAGYGSFSSSSSTTCSTAVDGPATLNVAAKVRDKDLDATEYTGTVTVANVKPTPAIDSLTGNGGVACIGGNTVNLGFSWTDPAATNDTYSHDVNWGDGNHTKNANFPTADVVYGASPVTGLTHSYAAGGPYTIGVTVNDSDSGAGNTVSSDPFSFLYNVTGVLQPVNDTQAHQDPSIFKYGSTVPVKIQVTDCNGTPVSGLSPTITVTRVNPTPPPDGFSESTSSTSSADTGTTMRWSDPLYIYNLATKPLSDGTATYKITITGPFATVTATFGLKTK